MRPQTLVTLALATAVLGACWTGHTPGPPAQLSTASDDNRLAAQLARIERRLTLIQDRYDRVSGHRSSIGPCRPSQHAPLLTMPARCAAASAPEEARAAMVTIALAQARGRRVERRMSREIEELRSRRKGVDAVDPVTGLQYEVLSGTKSNLDLHGKRMAGEMFRMITF